MSRIRLVVLSLVAVLAVSAAASASALAAETFGGVQCQPYPEGKWKDPQCTEKGPPNEYETMEITNSEVKGEGETAILKSEISTTKIYIDCQKTTFAGRIEKGGKSKSEIKYEKCVLYEESTGKPISTCTVPTITANVADEIVGGKGHFEDRFTPEKGEEFTKIKIEGASCTLKGTFEVKGSQRCELPDAEARQKKHAIRCKESGSSLKLGNKEAFYRGEVTAELVPPDDWWLVLLR